MARFTGFKVKALIQGARNEILAVQFQVASNSVDFDGDGVRILDIEIEDGRALNQIRFGNLHFSEIDRGFLNDPVQCGATGEQIGDKQDGTTC